MKRQKQSGFTLMETIIYIAIFGIMIVGLISFSITIANSRNKTYAVQEVGANIRFISSILNQKIRNADAVLAPTPGNSGTTLSLDMPNSDPNLTFSVSNGVLQMSEDGGNTYNLSSKEVSVANLLFKNLAQSGELDNIETILNISYLSGNNKYFDYLENLDLIVNRKN